ncbi:hypothetical protein JCM8547_007779 [Rhodosporidiobolus lusitaniae]
MPYDSKTGIHTAPRPEVSLPSGPLSIFDFLFSSEALETRPKDVPVLIDASSNRSYTFHGAHQRTLDLARAFHSHGVRENDGVVLFSPNDIDYGPVLFASFRQGVIASCANPEYQAEELAHQLETVNGAHPVKLIVAHPDSVVTTVKACEKTGLSSELIVTIGSSATSCPTNVKPLASGFPSLDDLVKSTRGAPFPPKVTLEQSEQRTKLALLSFSSGTTGLPKAVMIPHFAVIANVLQATKHWEETSDFSPHSTEERRGDVVCGSLPFYHIYGLVVALHGSFYQGLPVVILPRFQLSLFLDAVQRHHISILYVVPPIIIMLVKSELTKDYDLSSLRLAMTGAAPLTDDTLAAFRAKFPEVTAGQAYGMTECCTVVSCCPANDRAFSGAAAGILTGNIEARIVSLDGKFLGPNEIGELWSRGPSNALGYLNNEKATKETFDEEGFVHTGDEAKIDENGLLYIVDRIKELIKVSGFQVAPAELEGHLLTLDDVQDVAVIGIPEDKRGEAPKAFVVLSSPAKSRLESGKTTEAALVQSIKQHVLDHKIKYKALAEVELIEAIPKTASGKLLRKDLRVLHAQKAKSKKQKM